jgi:signal transduction histidine kinase
MKYQNLYCNLTNKLGELFYNLIHNSLRHAEKLSQIRVYYKKVKEDQLNLVYKDDGVGTPAGEKEKNLQ